jgi:hypothetical protein
MNKKLKMALLSLMVVGFSIGSVHADVEDAPGDPVYGPYDCSPPTSNTCVVVKDKNGKVVHTEKGVIKIS